MTVNAVSVDGVFHPLLVTDRVTADPPAFGVALAHVWPCVSETQAPIEAARAAAEALGRSQRADLHPDPRRTGRIPRG